MANKGIDGVKHELSSILSSMNRDFLVRNDDDQVHVSYLNGKIVALYFSGSQCGPCRYFTPKLIEAYEELSSKGDFEVVFVSSDRDEESFNGYFAKMPWLAIPFSDEKTCKHLKELFEVGSIPNLVFLDREGTVSCHEGVGVIRDYGAEAYPFTIERLDFFKEQEAAAKRNQTLRSILAFGSRDYLISNNGTRIPVSDLEGKIVGLYFCVLSDPLCAEFTPKLIEVYNHLKASRECFEIVLVSIEYDEKRFKECFQTMPWLALPFSEKGRERLVRYFEIKGLPTLVIIGQDGKTLNLNVVDHIDEYGIKAYPFSTEKLAELDKIEKVKNEAQTLESVLINDDKDFLINKNGAKVPVSELIGKNTLLYFSAEWCPPCRAFLPKLIESYHQIMATNTNAFEVIFISDDRDQSSFDEFYSKMPWLALPFGDERKEILLRKFKIKAIPAAVVLGFTGRTVTKEAKELIADYGADAFPFTDEHIMQLKKS